MCERQQKKATSYKCVGENYIKYQREQICKKKRKRKKNEIKLK